MKSCSIADCRSAVSNLTSPMPDNCRQEMFFGRKQEIAKIIGRDSEGILVYGGRQLGKSALLAQVQQLHNKPGEGRVIIREDVKSLGTSAREADEIWKIMSEKLRPHGVVGPKSGRRDAVIADIKRWINERPNRQVLCLLDETDNFLAFEAKNDFPNLMHVKGLMEDTSRAFKVVFAGLHTRSANVQVIEFAPGAFRIGNLCWPIEPHP